MTGMNRLLAVGTIHMPRNVLGTPSSDALVSLPLIITQHGIIFSFQENKYCSMMLWHFETQLECNNNDVVHARHPSQLHIIDEDLSLCSSGLRLPYKNYEFHLQEFLNARKVSVSMPDCTT